MIVFLFIRSAHDELRRRRVPDCRVLPSLPKPWRVLLSHIPARLMLVPIMGPSEHRAAFVPNDLLRVQEADAEETIKNFARKKAGVPDVSDLQAGYQRERIRPVGPRVTGDGRLGVASRGLLHVAAFRRPAFVEAGPGTPLGVELNPIRRICDHEERPAVAQQARYYFGARCVATQDPMLIAPVAT